MNKILNNTQIKDLLAGAEGLDGSYSFGRRLMMSIKANYPSNSHDQSKLIFDEIMNYLKENREGGKYNNKKFEGSFSEAEIRQMTKEAEEMARLRADDYNPEDEIDFYSKEGGYEKSEHRHSGLR